MKNRRKVQRKDELAIATQLTKRVRKDGLKRLSQYLHAVSLVFLFFWNATTCRKSYQSYEAHLTSTSLRGPIHSQPLFKFEQSTCKFKICLWQPLSEKTWKITQSIKHPTNHSNLWSVSDVFIFSLYLRLTKCHPKRANHSTYKWIQSPCHDQNSGYQVDSGAVYSFRRKFIKKQRFRYLI